MKHKKFKLENNELQFFYSFLYEYESDKSHKGFNARYLSKNLRALLAHKQKDIKKTNNSQILYTGKSVIKDFLTHLRNAVAHCNVQSNSPKDSFTLFDEDRNGKCSMYGQINKTIFYKLLDEIFKTRKL